MQAKGLEPLQTGHEASSESLDLERLAIAMTEAIEEEEALGPEARTARPAQVRLYSLVCAHLRQLRARGGSTDDVCRLVTDMLRNASSLAFEERALGRLFPRVLAWCSEAEWASRSNA
jgi:hypothetical protein